MPRFLICPAEWAGLDPTSESKKVVLVNGKELARLMIKYGLGVKKKTLEVPEIDEEFFQGL